MKRLKCEQQSTDWVIGSDLTKECFSWLIDPYHPLKYSDLIRTVSKFWNNCWRKYVYSKMLNSKIDPNAIKNPFVLKVQIIHLDKIPRQEWCNLRSIHVKGRSFPMLLENLVNFKQLSDLRLSFCSNSFYQPVWWCHGEILPFRSESCAHRLFILPIPNRQNQNPPLVCDGWRYLL